MIAILATISLHSQDWRNPESDDGETLSRFAQNLRAVPKRYRPIFVAVIHRDYKKLEALCRPQVRFVFYIRQFEDEQRRDGLPNLGEGSWAYVKQANMLSRKRLESDGKSFFRDSIEEIREGFSLFQLETGKPWRPGTYVNRNAHESVFGFHLKFASSSFVYLMIDPRDAKHPIVGFLQS